MPHTTRSSGSVTNFANPATHARSTLVYLEGSSTCYNASVVAMASAEGAAAKEPEHDVLYQGEAPPLPMVELETPALGVGREADARLVQELLEREPSLPLGEEIAKLKHIHASEDLRALAEHIEELEALHRTESDHRATASAFLDRLQAMAKRGRQVLLYVGGNKVRAFVSLGAGVGVGAAILIAVSRAPRRRQ